MSEETIAEQDDEGSPEEEAANPKAPKSEKKKLNREEKAAKQVEAYASARLSPLVLKYSIPSIIGMLCAGIQNIVNRIFVGRTCGSVALAGVQIGFPVTTLFMALAMLIGMGSMTLISIRLGQKRKKEADRILGQAIFLLFIIPTIIALIIAPRLDSVLVLIGASDTVLPYARDYFGIMIIAMIFFSMSVGLNNTIRAQGAPTVAMGTQILASIINIVLNYFFVMRFGWGVRGAAFGLLLGEFVSLFWIFGYFMRKSSYLSVRLKYIRPYPRAIKAVASLGIAPFLVQLAASMQQFIFNMRLSDYGGDAAISALAIVMSCSTILLLPMLGFSQGSQPIMGYNYGAGNFERIKGTLIRAICFGTIVGVLSWLFVRFYSPLLVKLFVAGDKEVELLTTHALKIYFLCIPLAPTVVCGGGLFQSCGKVVRSMILSLSRQVLFFIPLLLCMPSFYGLDGCWMSAPIADGLSFLLTILLVVTGIRAIRKEIEEHGVGNLVK